MSGTCGAEGDFYMRTLTKVYWGVRKWVFPNPTHRPHPSDPQNTGLPGDAATMSLCPSESGGPYWIMQGKVSCKEGCI